MRIIIDLEDRAATVVQPGAEGVEAVDAGSSPTFAVSGSEDVLDAGPPPRGLLKAVPGAIEPSVDWAAGATDAGAAPAPD